LFEAIMKEKAPGWVMSEDGNYVQLGNDGFVDLKNHFFGNFILDKSFYVDGKLYLNMLWDKPGTDARGYNLIDWGKYLKGGYENLESGVITGALVAN